MLGEAVYVCFDFRAKKEGHAIDRFYKPIVDIVWRIAAPRHFANNVANSIIDSEAPFEQVEDNLLVCRPPISLRNICLSPRYRNLALAELGGPPHHSQPPTQDPAQSTIQPSLRRCSSACISAPRSPPM